MTIRRIRPRPEEKVPAPQCSHEMPPPQRPMELWSPHYVARRTARCEERGWDVNGCMHYATHLIDGKPFCHLHAGMRALEKLEERDA